MTEDAAPPEPPPSRRGLRRAAIVALVLLLAAATPPVRMRIKAAATLADALGLGLPRPFSSEVTPVAGEVDGVAGRFYAGGEQPMLIVPGAAPAGLDDTRVNSLAAAIARSGYRVFIPQLDLYGEELTDPDLERIVTSVRGLSRGGGMPVPVLGISWGGSLALIAAADPRLEGHLGRVATFGAYFHLTGIIQAISTGTSLVGGESIPWQGHPVARDVMFARTAGLLPEPDRSQLVEALGGSEDPAGLSPDARSVYDLLTNDDPALTFPLAKELPPDLQEFLHRFSPATVAEDIGVPVAALHSTDDPVVPHGELTRLERALPDARVTRVALFEHVDFDATSPREWLAVAPDMVRMWNYTTWLLAG